MNPFSLLKKAVVTLAKAPLKSLVFILVIVDKVTKGAASSDICQEVVFSPTGSGRSYTMQTYENSCAHLNALASTDSSQFCVTKLNSYDHIHISSLSDIPRIDPANGRPFQDTLGFYVCGRNTGAIVRDKSTPGKKIWKGIENPRCPSISFFVTPGVSMDIRDSAPSELRAYLNRERSHIQEPYEHCSEASRLTDRRCRTEL